MKTIGFLAFVDLAPSLSPLQSLSSTGETGRLRKRDNFLTRGGKGMGRAQAYEKASSSIIL
jgi:hypothetical protein